MQFLKKQNKKWILAGKIGLIIVLCIGCVAAVIIGTSITQESKAEQFESPKEDETFLITDADQVTQQGNPVVVNLAETAAYVISEAGEYVLTGQGSEPVVIDAQEQIVHLYLDQAEIRTNCGPAIAVKSAGKVIITLVEGSTNVLQDAAIYTGYEDYDAALYSQSDLTINGNGSLYVYGYYEDAIHSKDIVKLLGGKIYLQAKDDGIKGNDGVLAKPSELSIESEQYGIRTTKSGKQHKGDIDMCGGDISIISGQHSFVTDADLYVRDCKLYCKSVASDMDVAGERYVEEECYVNE